MTFLAGTDFDHRERGADDVLAQLEYRRLLLAVGILILDRQVVLAFL